MKYIYKLLKPLFFLLLCFLAMNVSAQIVTIPDTALKSKLLNHNPVIDTNGDLQIQVSEAQAVTGNLDLTNPYSPPASEIIYDATGIEAFVNVSGIDIGRNSLTTLDISTITGLDSLKVFWNGLTTLDISQNPNLIKVNAARNDLTSFVAAANTSMQELNLSGNLNLLALNVGVFPNLKRLEVAYTGISTIDLTTLAQLEYLDTGKTPLTSIDLNSNIALKELRIVETDIVELDVSNNPILEKVYFFYNPQLTYINLKNGNNLNMDLGEGFYEVPNLEAVCVDEIPVNFAYQWYASDLEEQNIILSTYCNFVPGQFNTIAGNLKVDMGTGCAASAVNVPNVLIETVDNSASTTTSATFTDQLGQFSLYVGQGGFTTTADLMLPSYYSVSPTSHSSTFTSYGNTDQADFCISSSQSVNDLSVTIVPMFPARPGFDVDYLIICKNMGTAPATGQVVFQFDPAKQSFLSAVPAESASTASSVTFDFANLEPFHSYEIGINLQNVPPPTMQLGNILTLTASIMPDTNDYAPNDNTFQLQQTVVGSYDPNDKQVLEGDKIAIADAGEYLHYLIRFQNMGTASAINVVVSDVLSDQLDWSSFRMLSASHDYRAEITDGKYVEFIFEGINLPHEAANAAGSHGFVAFKIKPKSGIAVGDIIEGNAAIFFDFNAPIITNTVSTEVVQNLSVKNFETDSAIRVFPNPTNGILNIASETNLKKISIFSLTGKRLFQKENSLTKIDLHGLSKGIYFVEITDETGSETVRKIVIE